MTRAWAIAIVLGAIPASAVAQAPDDRERLAARDQERRGDEDVQRDRGSDEAEREEDGAVEARERAEEAGPEEASETEEEARPEPSIPPRPIPDYGRPPPESDVGDDLLWIPRVVFFPLHLFFEYGLRRPVGWVLRLIELERLDALFVQGAAQADERREGAWWFVPRFTYDHGFQPTIGLGFRANDPERRYALRLRLEGWPADQIFGLARGTMRIDRTSIVLEASGGYRTDRIYHGLGWNTPDWTRARYTDARGDANLFLEARPWRRSVISGGVRAGVHRFDDSDFRQGEDRSIDEAILLGNLARPPGYPRGYTVVEPWVRAVIDTREEPGWPHASGVRADLLGAWGFDAERGVEASWARAGASVDVGIEVMRDRTLRLRALAELVEPLAHRAIPFTEQVWLGGAMDRMPGFLLGRLVGQSAASIGVSWRYAIWSWMDAELFVDAGNVFGRLFEDFEPERLRLSFGTALLTRDPEDFSLLLAFGTEPFVRGADLTSVRFAVSIGAPP